MNFLKAWFSLIQLLLNPDVLLPTVLVIVILSVILISTVIVVVILVEQNKEYKESAYYQVTKSPYLSVRYDAGRYGEYLTYKYLSHMEAAGAKFLFNVYIPKANGETTEIDVLMICPTGIYVFESKNYSGWIFGSEGQKNWYQTLPAGRRKSHKEHFYNPVMQNRSHIKHLRAFLGEQLPMHSIIVFSDRCTLKNIQIYSKDISVINRYNVAPVVSEIWNRNPAGVLTNNSITEIYNKLYPFTQVDEIAKAQHVLNIHNNLNSKPIHQVSPAHVNPVVQKAPTTESIPTAQTAIASKDSAVVDVASPVLSSESEPIEMPNQSPKCPLCNGNLILRTATRGVNAGNQFYGCSNYPKCKYIQNLPHNKTK